MPMTQQLDYSFFELESGVYFIHWGSQWAFSAVNSRTSSLTIAFALFISAQPNTDYTRVNSTLYIVYQFLIFEKR